MAGAPVQSAKGRRSRFFKNEQFTFSLKNDTNPKNDT